MTEPNIASASPAQRNADLDIGALLNIVAPDAIACESAEFDGRYPSSLRGLKRLLARFSPRRRARLERERREYAAFAASALFSASWYLQAYPEVREQGFEPLLHYIRYGWRRGFAPGPLFDGARYLSANPDVARADINPLWHFLATGFFEGRIQGSPFEAFVTPGPEAVETLRSLSRWSHGETPDISIVIVTPRVEAARKCLQRIWRHSHGHSYEILVVEYQWDAIDGMSPIQSGRLRRLPLGSGEPSTIESINIAAEAARGRRLCLLDPGVLPRPGWLDALTRRLDGDAALGAAGALRAEPDIGSFVSTKALLIARDLFLEVGGLDFTFEPGGFEDVDLCLKVRACGRSVALCEGLVDRPPQAEAKDDARRKGIENLNRDKLLARWGAALPDPLPEAREKIIPPRWSAQPDVWPTAAVYTPYVLTPGGGERYILSVAAVLAETHRVTLVTPSRQSALRLRNLTRDLGIALPDLSLATEQDFLSGGAPEILVSMGNSVLPNIRAHGVRSFYHCQFPFSLKERPHPSALDGYQAVIVNSDYTRQHFARAIQQAGFFEQRVEIVHPPSPWVGPGGGAKARMILSVGRFFVGGHAKRQDILIEAFADLLNGGVKDVELHLAGSSQPWGENLDYLARLRERAKDLPVVFHVNCSHGELADLYRRSGFYWHAAGFGVDLAQHPEQAEHFGLSLVEAMSAGALPLAYEAGGPKEIISAGANGFFFTDARDLVAKTARLLDDGDAARLAQMRAAACERAKAFDQGKFRERLRALFRGELP